MYGEGQQRIAMHSKLDICFAVMLHVKQEGCCKLNRKARFVIQPLNDQTFFKKSIYFYIAKYVFTPPYVPLGGPLHIYFFPATGDKLVNELRKSIGVSLLKEGAFEFLKYLSLLYCVLFF